MKGLKTERVGLTNAMNADFPLPPSQLIIREPMFLAKVFALGLFPPPKRLDLLEISLVYRHAGLYTSRVIFPLDIISGWSSQLEQVSRIKRLWSRVDETALPHLLGS